MATNVEVPGMGESVREAVLLRWYKQDGEMVATDEPLAELETDKANVDVPSPAAGVIQRSVGEGTTVKVGQLIATIDASGKASVPAAAKATKASGAASAAGASATPSASASSSASASATAAPARAFAPPPVERPRQSDAPPATATPALSPAVRRLVEEKMLDAAAIPGSGPSGRLTKDDVLKFIEESGDNDRSDTGAAAAATAMAADPAPRAAPSDGEGVHRAPMSKIRRRIAENLVRAQQSAALLTTFNEVDLHAVMDLRARHKERFEKAHGVGLGLMSFFVRACTTALREFPRVNGRLDGDDVLTFDHVHMGIAVSTERGLAVPVLRHAERLSFAAIESEIKRLAAATRDGKLSLQELSGGTFSITNGGVFGSMLSTPIVNPPQSAILGMHAIQKRAVVVNDQVAVRPVMYVALTYDHRLIDGRESVSFLFRVKELLEDPARMMLEI